MLNVITGLQAMPRRTVFYGVGGIGKSTLASHAPGALFIQTEDGLNDIDCSRLPLCKTLPDVQAQMRMVFQEDHQFKTLIIDSLDQLEPMIWTSVATDAGKGSISEIGFGKGYEAALVDWRRILFMLDRLRTERHMHIILIAHAKIERFEDPANEAYDRYGLQLHKKAAAEISHWADEILFANYKVYVRKTDQGFRERTIAAGAGERVIYTSEMPGWVAKNRLALPAEIPFTWQAYAEHFATGAGVGSLPTNNDGLRPVNPAPAPPEELTAMGFAPVDLEQMDASQLRECGLLLRDKFNAREVTTFKKAVANADCDKMRAIITRAMGKPNIESIAS